MRNLKYFRKLSILMVSRILGELLSLNCVEKQFHLSFQISKIHEIYLNLSKNDHF